MTDLKRFEKAAVVILIIWVVTLIPNRLDLWALVLLYSGKSEELSHFSNLMKILGFTQGLISGAVNIAVAFWMFVQARRDGAARCVWMLFGLVFGLIAPMLYFLLQLLQELRALRILKQDGQPVSSHNG